jgi:expansin (peptidoglycan-binding protein)
MSAMRRLTFFAVPLVLLLACSSDDAGDSSTLERATVDGGASSDGASAEGKASSDGGSGGTSEAGADAAPTVDYSGEATYYAADGTGACGFKASPNDLNVAAMNKSQYGKSWCGQCVLVAGPKGTVKVRIVDLCPGCAHGDLDLSEQAFTAIASLSAGRVKITWHVVAC